MNPLGLALAGIGILAIITALLVQRLIKSVVRRSDGSPGAPRIMLPMMVVGGLIAVAGVVLMVTSAVTGG